MTVTKSADGTITITATTGEARLLWVASQSLAINGEDDGRIGAPEAAAHGAAAEALWPAIAEAQARA